MSIRQSLAPIQHLLCCAVAGDSTQRTDAACNLRQRLGDDALMALSKRNDVASLVAHALIQTGDANLPEYWKDVHKAVQERISAYLSELDRIAGRLAEEGIPLVALKNGGIARGIYPCLGCCPMGDLDVLVEKRNFRKAHEILLESGYHFEFRNPMEETELAAAEKGGGSEYWKILPNGDKFWLELQWRPVGGRWIRPDQEPTAEELVARSINIPGIAVRLLSPEDNLLQVALHTAKHTYVRAPGFRLHLDVERIVRAYPNQDWATFVQRVQVLQVKTAVYFSLAIPAELFGTPIPDWVLQRLHPPRWKKALISRWLNRVALFNPHERKFGTLGYILFTLLLYDDFRGFWRGVFPDRTWMCERYGAEGKGPLVLAHIRRILNLAFRRVNS